jgi:TetR/AcrR family transcriptional regulator
LTRQPLEQSAKDARSDDRREQILDAALRVFADVGFAHATTKAIAAAAELRSPTLIYWYFPSKEDLLRAVFVRFGVVLQATGENPPMDVPPEVALPFAARRALAFFENEHTRCLYRLWMAEWPRLEKLGISLEQGRPSKNVYTTAQAYLERQIELGTLRPHDTKAAARAFVALVWSQVEARHLFPSIYPTALDNDEYVERVIGLFIDGLRPRPH